MDYRITMKRVFTIISSLLALTVCFSCSQQGAKDIKTISILGDSYSTFEGHNPEGNAIWYFDNRQNGANDVIKLEQTWWKLFCEEGGYELLLNDSYSGSTICNTGYNREDYKDRSFITRMVRCIEDQAPDMLMIFGATNDSWANSPVGELQFEDWTDQDLYSCLPAYCYMLDYLTTNAKDTEIVCVINSELKYEIVAGIMEACEHYGAKYILLKDIDKIGGHPSIEGMKQINEQLTTFMETL